MDFLDAQILIYTNYSSRSARPHQHQSYEGVGYSEYGATGYQMHYTEVVFDINQHFHPHALLTLRFQCLINRQIPSFVVIMHIS